MIPAPEGSSQSVTTQGLSVNVQDSWLSGGGAFGGLDNVQAAFDNQAFFMLDDYGRDFSINLKSRLISNPSDRDNLFWHMKSKINYRTGFDIAGVRFNFTGSSVPEEYRTDYQIYSFNEENKTTRASITANFSYETGAYSIRGSLNGPGLSSSNNTLAFSNNSSTSLPGMKSAGNRLALGFGNWQFLSVFDQGYQRQNAVNYNLSNDARPKWKIQGFALQKEKRSALLNTVFQVGMIVEKGRVLGLEGAGALSPGEGATSFFSRIESSIYLTDRSSIKAEVIGSLTRVKATPGSYFEKMTSLNSTEWALSFNTSRLFYNSDVFSLSLRQPLKIERGTAYVSDVSGRYHSGFIYGQRAINLSPRSREIDVETAYSAALTQSVNLRINAVYRFNDNHDYKDGVAGFIAFNSKF